MKRRPKHTKPDSNQAEIVADLRAVGCRVIITASLPGYQIAEYDAIQVDAGKHVEDALDLFVLASCRRRWAQIEVKQGIMSTFRPGQIAYLRSLGRWPPENDSDIPVLVVYNAGDVLNWFFRECGCETCGNALLEWRKKKQ